MSNKRFRLPRLLTLTLLTLHLLRLLLRRLGERFVLRRGREALSLKRGATVATMGALDQGLGLGGVLASILLGDLGGMLGVLLGDGAQLGRLGGDEVLGVLELGVDGLLVLEVDERAEEGDGRREKGEEPIGEELDEEVGDKGGDGGLVLLALISSVKKKKKNRRGLTYRNRKVNILDKQQALAFDDEKVEQLVGVANHGVERLARDGVVGARAQA